MNGSNADPVGTDVESSLYFIVDLVTLTYKWPLKQENILQVWNNKLRKVHYIIMN